MSSTSGSKRPLRLGILGTARGAPMIIVKPIQRNPDLQEKVELLAVGSRDGAKAAAFAKEYNIPRSYGSYAELIADPDIDAVYVSLPPTLHCEWSVRSLQAGKHVLCSKPFTCNAREAVVVQRAAEDAGKVCLEAFHALRHPIMQRVKQMVSEGRVGSIKQVDVRYMVDLSQYDGRVRSKMHEPTPMWDDYRLRHEMGGGVTMDLGCYCLAIIRAITGEEPFVTDAKAKKWKDDGQVDASMTCNFGLPSGAGASFECSFMAPQYSEPIYVNVCGTNGELRIQGFFNSHKANQITCEQWDDAGIVSTESVDDPNVESTKDSFYYQLLVFAQEISEQARSADAGLPWSYTPHTLNTPPDSVKNMSLIDDIYRKAGMQPRKTMNSPPSPYDHIGMSKL